MSTDISKSNPVSQEIQTQLANMVTPTLEFKATQNDLIKIIVLKEERRLESVVREVWVKRALAYTLQDETEKEFKKFGMELAKKTLADLVEIAKVLYPKMKIEYGFAYAKDKNSYAREYGDIENECGILNNHGAIDITKRDRDGDHIGTYLTAQKPFSKADKAKLDKAYEAFENASAEFRKLENEHCRADRDLKRFKENKSTAETEALEKILSKTAVGKGILEILESADIKNILMLDNEASANEASEEEYEF